MVKSQAQREKKRDAVGDAIQRIACQVVDPELPVLTLGDLAMVRDVWFEKTSNNYVVDIIPSFTACPATEVILQDVQSALAEAGYKNIKVRRVLSPAWSSAWISEAGRKKLQEAGIALPDLQKNDASAQCPICQSRETVMVSAFGSTLCKSSHKCQKCQEPFEAFKCH